MTHQRQGLLNFVASSDNLKEKQSQRYCEVSSLQLYSPSHDDKEGDKIDYSLLGALPNPSGQPTLKKADSDSSLQLLPPVQAPETVSKDFQMARNCLFNVYDQSGFEQSSSFPAFVS